MALLRFVACHIHGFYKNCCAFYKKLLQQKPETGPNDGSIYKRILKSTNLNFQTWLLTKLPQWTGPRLLPETEKPRNIKNHPIVAWCSSDYSWQILLGKCEALKWRKSAAFMHSYCLYEGFTRCTTWVAILQATVLPIFIIYKGSYL